MVWPEILLKSFTVHAFFSVHLCLLNFNCMVFSSEKINHWRVSKAFVRKEEKVLDTSYCFGLFTNHCICFSTSFQVWKKNFKISVLSLSLDLDNAGCIFLFSWVRCHNLWFHIFKFIFTTNHLPSLGERLQQNPNPDNLPCVSDPHQTPQGTVHVNG